MKKFKIVKKIFFKSKKVRLITLLSVLVLVGFSVFVLTRKKDVQRFVSSGFSLGQSPELVIQTDLSLDEVRKRVSVYRVTDEEDTEADVAFEVSALEDNDPENPSVKVSLFPSSDTPSGRYEVRLRENTLRMTKQDFSWGVLALNTTKSVYTPDETVNVEMAVLDEKGGMDCTAKLTLEITSPEGKVKSLSNDENNTDITKNKECWIKDIVDKPDYETSFNVGDIGNYQLKLSAETVRGTYIIYDYIEVVESVPFVVERDTQTRIYPLKDYPVRIHITANQDFQGTITETIPADFKLEQDLSDNDDVDIKVNFIPLDENGKPIVKEEQIEAEQDSTTQLTANSYQLEANGDHQVLSWQANLKQGDSIILEYFYDAPDSSPMFYLLGELGFYTDVIDPRKSDLQNPRESVIFAEKRRWQIAVDDVFSLRPNGDGSNDDTYTFTDQSSNACGTGTECSEEVNDDPDSATDSAYIVGPNISGATTDAEMFLTLTSTPEDFSQAAEVEINARHQENGDDDDTIDASYQIYEDDEVTAITAATTPITLTQGSWTTDSDTVSITGTNNKTAWDGATLSIYLEESQSGPPGACIGWISAVEVNITYYPMSMNQRSYIFENDDGTTVNNNSNIASYNTPITNVRKGERFIARLQIDNESAASDTQTLKLQYAATPSAEWSNVGHMGAPSANSGSDQGGWNVETTYNITENVGQELSMAIGTDGYPVIVHVQGSLSSAGDTDYLLVTKCSDNICSSTNSITTTLASLGIDDSTSARPSIAIGADNYPVISYYDDNIGADLKLIHCTNTSCSTYDSAISLDTTDDVGDFSSIAIGTDGYPVISYYDTTSTNLKLVHCTSNNCSSYDTPVTLDSTDAIGTYTSIAVGTDGYPAISYRDTSAGSLKVVKCNDTACSGDDETISTVDDTNNVGSYTSIAIGTDGYPVISYHDDSDDSLKVAKCDDAACSGSNETTTTVDDHSSDTIGRHTSIAIGTDGYPIISYRNYSDSSLKVTKCNDAACSESDETIVTIDDPTILPGEYSSIAIGTDGYPVISYHDADTDSLKVAKYSPTAEINVAKGLSGSDSDSLTAIEAGSCGTGSSQNGKWHEATNETDEITLPADTCTEVAFVLDTSRAVYGTTYLLRLVTAVNEESLYSYTQYPTFTIVDKSTSNKRYSKEVITTTGSGCSNSSEYTCTTIESTDDVGSHTSIAIGTDGYPVVSYHKFTGADLKLVHCKDAICSSFDTPVTLDSTGNVGYYTSIAIGVDRYPLISYFDSSNTALKLVHCTNAICSSFDTPVTLDSVDDVGYHTSITIGTDGYPVISYYDDTNYNLELIHCTSVDCSSYDTPVTLDSTGDVGQYTSIAIGSNGYPVISYYDTTNTALKLVHCTSTNCTSNDTPVTLDSTDDVGSYTSIAIGTDGYPVISYHDATNTTLEFVHCTSSNCSSYDTPVTLDSVGIIGKTTSIAIGLNGYPTIAYQGSINEIKIAQCNNATCSGGEVETTIIHETGDSYTTTYGVGLAFGVDGLPVIARYNNDSDIGDLEVIKKTALPLTAPAYFDTNDNQLKYKNASDSAYPQFVYSHPPHHDGLDYWLDSNGYSDILSDDANYDSITSSTSSATPVYTFIDKRSLNTSSPNVTWKGKSSVAASTNNIVLQIFRFGSTNAWETVATNTSCVADTACTINGEISSNISDYYFYRPEYDSYKRDKGVDDKFWTYWRVYQEEGAQTLYTGYWLPETIRMYFDGINMQGININ